MRSVIAIVQGQDSRQTVRGFPTGAHQLKVQVGAATTLVLDVEQFESL